MTSAFSPVIQRAGSPRVPSSRRPSGKSNNTTFKRGRDINPLLGQPLELVTESSREEGESPSPPDHVSTSGSSTGSAASNESQGPKILDFIGATCEVTSWFSSCFPCAVVDIDEHDGRVTDRLSKESAMNVMYSPTKAKVEEPLPEEVPQADYQGGPDEYSHHTNVDVESSQIGAVDSDVMYTHLPFMTAAESDHIRSKSNAHKLLVIEDDEATEVETVSLDSERQAASPVHSQSRKKHAIVPKKVKKLFKSSSRKKKNAERHTLVRS